MELTPVIVGLLLLIQQISSQESQTYWAGVVEFSSEPANQPNADRIQKVVNGYINIIESENAENLDIIVFPEATLNDLLRPFEIPEAADQISPCDSDDYDPHLKTLACSARRARKYVVINVTQKQNDTDGQALHFNSNVVFDRNGTVISTYRKFNLFVEPGTNVTKESDFGMFTTDFGVTFGHFICFDILFRKPAQELVNMYNITDILYPTMWFSELPFLTAVQTQSMWAQKHRVNLIAAGASNPEAGSTGSGIYSQNGAIVDIMTPFPERKLYKAEVKKREFWDDDQSQKTPKWKPRSDFSLPQLTDLKLMRDNLDVYKSKELNSDLNETQVQERLCYDKLCCDFKITMAKKVTSENSKSYQYRAVVFDGVRSYSGAATGGTFTCAIVACTNSTIASCGIRFEKTDIVEEAIEFKEIEVTGKFRSSENITAFATSVTFYILPLPYSDFEFEESEEFLEKKDMFRNISVKLKTPHSDLLAFGIYGRDFEKDGQKPSSAISIVSPQFVLLAIIVVTLISKTF